MKIKEKLIIKAGLFCLSIFWVLIPITSWILTLVIIKLPNGNSNAGLWLLSIFLSVVSITFTYFLFTHIVRAIIPKFDI
jgi:hypothetical protein